MEWKVLDEPIRMYGFAYDDFKRLEAAKYAQQLPMIDAEVEETDAFSTIYAYDENGNIDEIERNGVISYINNNYHYEKIDDLDLIYEGNRLKNVSEGGGFYHSHGYDPVGQEYTYDDAGNVTYDGGKGVDFKNYNALDLPIEVERITSTGTITGKVVNTYDASGTKWSTDHTYYNHGSHNQNIKYVNGLELLDNGQFVLHHEEGRYVSNSGESNYEYVISDHLGNGRVWFQDLDGDGDLSLDPANLEVKQVKHYYPFGMTMGIQSLQSYSPPRDRNQYNGIEYFEGLDYNMAFYRTLDPGIGRWLQIDPKEETLIDLTPYNSMANNPISFNDPRGDVIPLLVVAGAAVVNGLINVGSQALKGNVKNFWHGLEYFGVGAAAGALYVTPGGQVAAGALQAGGNKIVQIANGQWDPSEIKNGWDVAELVLDVGGDALTPALGAGLGKGLANNALIPLAQRAGWTSTVSGGGALVKTGGAAGDIAFSVSLENAINVTASKATSVGVNKGISALAGNTIKHLGDDIINQGVKYHPRLIKQNDLYHRFPKLFDKHIIKNGSWSQRLKDGANIFELEGTINGTKGIYQIGVNNKNVIFHRNFMEWNYYLKAGLK